MKKIKIAHIVVGLDGGVGNVILNYFDHMPLDDYEVHILAHDISSDLYKTWYEERGFKVIKLPVKREGIFKCIKYIKKLCQENQYDIVHCHQTLTSIIPLLAAKMAGVKVRISHSHLVAVKGNSKVDDCLIFLSQHFSKKVATYCMACGQDAGLSVFGEKQSFKVLNNALDLALCQYSPIIREQQRKLLDLQDSFVIGNVGRFTKQKNHKFLIDYFYLLSKHMDVAKLLLIGDGELLEDMKRYVEQLEISNKVIFLGAINDVPNKLQAMDLFVLPSLAEGLPVVALEAQASGLACIISNQVTREVGVLPATSYLPIKNEQDLDKWVDLTLTLSKMPREINVQSLLRQRGYNIIDEAKKLDELYKAMLKR